MEEMISFSSLEEWEKKENWKIATDSTTAMPNSQNMKSLVHPLLREPIIPLVVTKEKFTFSEEMAEEDMKTQSLKIFGSLTQKIMNGNLYLLKKIQPIQNLEHAIQCSFLTKVFISMVDGTTFKDLAMLLNIHLQLKNGNQLLWTWKAFQFGIIAVWKLKVALDGNTSFLVELPKNLMKLN